MQHALQCRSRDIRRRSLPPIAATLELDAGADVEALLAATAAAQGWQPVDSLLRLEASGYDPGAGMHAWHTAAASAQYCQTVGSAAEACRAYLHQGIPDKHHHNDVTSTGI